MRGGSLRAGFAVAAFGVFVALVAVLLGSRDALADAPAGETRTIGSVFFIAKSENKNQVHYGIVVDRSCAPIGAAPVFAYWRMLERGPLATEPLLDRELPAYGIASQRPERRAAGERGGRVTLTLRALPQRPIVIDVVESGGACTATATAWIGGVRALLGSVYAKLKWPFGVAYLLLIGRAWNGGGVVEERVSP